VLAANIFHWWLGVGLTVVSVAAVLALVAGYAKSVTGKRYPNGRRDD
jgi:hypothetical protein